MPVVQPLSRNDVYLVVNKFVGAPGGDLNGFSYNKMYEFFEYECGVSEQKLQGIAESTPNGGRTKREFFHAVLEGIEPPLQAMMLEKLLERFAEPDPSSLPDRTASRPKVEAMLARLKTPGGVALPSPTRPSEIVQKALAEARTLHGQHGSDAALDRVHTAMHGYLKDACDLATIAYPADPTIMTLYKKLRESHPKMTLPTGWESEVDKTLKAQASVLDGYNTVRNNATGAHPNPRLPDPEANLFLDAASTLFRYLHTKIET